MVAGIHCRGDDLAFFPPRLFFPATFVYICSENAVHIGEFYFSQTALVPAACYLRKAPESLCSPLTDLLSNAR